MAIVNSGSAQTGSVKVGANGKELKQADGWLNIKLLDKHGKEHAIDARIPLYLDSNNKAVKALLKYGQSEDFVAKITGTVFMVDTNPEELEL